MGDLGVSGQGTPDTNGIEANVYTLQSSTSTERVTPLNETNSVLIQASNDNNNRVYIDFAEQVDKDAAIELPAGSTINFDLDVSQQSIYAKPEKGGDKVITIGTN